MRLISNIESNHGVHFAELLKERFDELFLVSPYLAANFETLFENVEFSSLNLITLVTTLRKNDQDQITKPKSLKSFYRFVKAKCPKANVKVHIDNGLHGKIYIFRRSDNCKAIVTSANLTHNGFFNNHEWGLLIEDEGVARQLKSEVLECIEYPDISESIVDRLVAFSSKNLENNPQWLTDGAPHTDVLNDVYFQGKNAQSEPRYYLKPVGVSEDPIWKEDRNDYSELHQDLDFSKKGTGAIRAGDIVITTAVGCGCLLSYFEVTGSPKEATFEEQQTIPWKQRWPWHIEGRNLSTDYGGVWWQHDLDRKILLEKFRNLNPDEPVTKSGGFTLGTINFGSDKVEITKKFAEFLIGEIHQAGN